MHAGWQCATWSGALSVPPGGAPKGTQPAGPYRGPHARADLSAAVRQRVAEADVCMQFAVRVGIILHDQGKSVTFENSPDCRDSSDPWFLRFGVYTSATQFPVWAEPVMARYITYTKSILVTRPLCGAGSAYRNFKTLCMNPPAFAESSEYQALVCCGLRHTPMSGYAANGESHGARAERYTPRFCGILYRIHRAAARKHREEAHAQGKRRRSTADPAPSGGPLAPPAGPKCLPPPPPPTDAADAPAPAATGAAARAPPPPLHSAAAVSSAAPLTGASVEGTIVQTRPITAQGAENNVLTPAQPRAAHAAHSGTFDERGIWRRSEASRALVRAPSLIPPPAQPAPRGVSVSTLAPARFALSEVERPTG